MITQLGPLFFTSWMLQLLLVCVPVASGLGEIALYDFWDDSLFDDLKKDGYSLGYQPNRTRASVEDCVRTCESSPSCITLFYQARDKSCEFVVTNLELEIQAYDLSLRRYRENRYYRYFPPEAGNCPMDKCFYYNKQAKVCWKVMYRSGPRASRSYNQADARDACKKEGGRLAIIDTLDKLDQITLRASNLPFIVSTDGKCSEEIYIGGSRRDSNSPIVFANGNTLSEDPRFRHPDFADQLGKQNYNCLTLKGLLAGGRFKEYRIALSLCFTTLQAVICEWPPS